MLLASTASPKLSSAGETGSYVIALEGATRVATCPGDLNFDGIVDGADLPIMLGNWGPCADCFIDLNNDNTVDMSDAVHVLSYLFRAGPPPILGTECVPIFGCPENCTPAG